MAPMTRTQVQRMCRHIGMTKREALIASAIAMCEAPIVVDGEVFADPDAVGDQDLADDTWGYSYSLFQVRSLRAQKGTGGWRDENLLPRPNFNCRAAYAIKQVQGWAAWTTYQNGQYKAYLQDTLFPPEPGTYIVVYGDTLSGIAARYSGFTWQELAAANNLHDPYPLSIGQVLRLPATAALPLGSDVEGWGREG